MEKLDIKSRVKKTSEQESKQAVAIHDEMDNLTALTHELDRLRREVAVDARYKDLDYVRKIDVVIETILTALTDNREELSEAVLKMLKKADMRGLKDLMVALGVTVDKREALLGFDETRRMRKKKLNLKVIFQGPDGTQAGVSVEQEG